MACHVKGAWSVKNVGVVCRAITSYPRSSWDKKYHSYYKKNLP